MSFGALRCVVVLDLLCFLCAGLLFILVRCMLYSVGFEFVLYYRLLLIVLNWSHTCCFAGIIVVLVLMRLVALRVLLT